METPTEGRKISSMITHSLYAIVRKPVIAGRSMANVLGRRVRARCSSAEMGNILSYDSVETKDRFKQMNLLPLSALSGLVDASRPWDHEGRSRAADQRHNSGEATQLSPLT